MSPPKRWLDGISGEPAWSGSRAVSGATIVRCKREGPETYCRIATCTAANMNAPALITT